MSTVDPGQLQITAVRLSQATTTEIWQITATNYFGQQVGAIAVFGPAVAINNGNTTFTIPRASSGSGPQSWTAQASAEGYATRTKLFTVAQQDAVVLGAAALSVGAVTLGSTTVTIPFTFSGTLTWKLNGVNQGDPGGTPLVASRPSPGSADSTATLHCVGADGSILERDIALPAQAASGTTATDLTTVIALANAMHAVLIAKGEMT